MSITYRIFFTLILLGTSLQLAAQDQTERHYRVELIVVRHLAGSSDSTPQETLRDLTEILDLYAPVPEGTAPGQPDGDKAAPEETDPLATPALSDGELLPEEPVAVRIDDMSDTMREAWRRLRGSSGFRPELFRAWEQSGNEPFPQLRIHDDEVLFEIDPSTALGSAPLDEHGALVFSDKTMNDVANPDTTDLPGDELEVPAIEYFYRIDGSARLTRTRFLHLDLDVELREPLYERLYEGLAAESPDFPNETATTEAVPTDAISRDRLMLPAESAKRTGPAANASAFRIHRIAQKRQVKAEQMEYFDGPVIGLLVLVTGFDVSSEITEPEPAL